MTHRSQALLHLQTLKPGDGWSLQENSSDSTVKLCRRGVPLTDNSFVDLYYDGADVVGLLSRPATSSTTTLQAQVLVDSKGQPVRGMKLKAVRINNTNNVQAAPPPTRGGRGGDATTRTSQESPSTSRTSTTGFSSSWTPEQHRQLWQVVGTFVAATVMIRLLFQTLFVLYLCAFPLLFIYLLQTCPVDDSFDAKQQLKRVLRGAHLPENHPDKPKGVLSEALARLQATVTTELATLPGYEVTIINLIGAVKIASVRVPTAKMDFYWVGAMNQWYYVCSTDISGGDKMD